MDILFCLDATASTYRQTDIKIGRPKEMLDYGLCYLGAMKRETILYKFELSHITFQPMPLGLHSLLVYFRAIWWCQSSVDHSNGGTALPGVSLFTVQHVV